MSVDLTALIVDMDTAISTLRQIESGRADVATASFIGRDRVHELTTQMIALKSSVDDTWFERGTYFGGVGRAIIENANTLDHPVADLCMSIQGRFNSYVSEVRAHAKY